MVRLTQIAYVLLAAGLAYGVCLYWTSPGPLAIVVGAVALVAIVMILIRPASWEAWESFWESVAGWVGWW